MIGLSKSMEDNGNYDEKNNENHKNHENNENHEKEIYSINIVIKIIKRDLR